jgi:NAD(P)-dependent dehydrogenase (short-subunit alcohol dehydrogenase family)
VEVVVHGRSAERGIKLVRDIKNAGGKARFVAADLAVPDGVRRLAAEAGPVDILINNAGVYRFAPTAETDDAFFDEHVALNLRARPTSWCNNWCRAWWREAPGRLSM